jgi:hypothetical protein
MGKRDYADITIPFLRLKIGTGQGKTHGKVFRKIGTEILHVGIMIFMK